MTTFLLSALLILAAFGLGMLAMWRIISWKIAVTEKHARDRMHVANEMMSDARALHDKSTQADLAAELQQVIDWVRVDHQSRSAVVTSGVNAQTWEVALRHRAGGQVDLSAKGQGGLSEAVGQAMDAMRRAAN
jgi:hypothetical protein